MNGLHLAQHELSAIKAIDVGEVERCVDQALGTASASPLFNLNLSCCGPVISDHLRRYQRDLASYAKAKAPSKRAATQGQSWIAGRDLVFAVRDTQQRIEEHEKETELLRVNDDIAPPYRLSDRIEVRVPYQWRRKVDDSWVWGSITFVHNVDMRPDYTQQLPKRKPSAAKLERERQDSLYRHWEHLRVLAVHAVVKFLRSGGDGTAIPESYSASPAARDRFLSNFSCDFWQEQICKNS